MSPPNRVEAIAERSELVRQALEMARELHDGTVRDVGDEVPFIEHPLAVAELLAEHELGDELVAAGLLHDTLEYTDLGLGGLRERFGMKVAMIVCALSEDFEIEDYEERKRELRRRVAATGIEAQRVFAADKIANVIEARDDYVLIQEDVDLGMLVDLDLKILVWEYDMEMLIETDEDEPLFKLLPEELIGLWDQRCTQMRADSA
ncbi:MAG TPA: HD domain-containing protein [Solirubrobacterales bacterium]|nr:HD domain-containing protein [Solirubrobacterales bacterium]